MSPSATLCYLRGYFRVQSYSYVRAFLSCIINIMEKDQSFFSSNVTFHKVSSLKTRAFYSYFSDLVLQKVPTPKIGLSDDI